MAGAGRQGLNEFRCRAREPTVIRTPLAVHLVEPPGVTTTVPADGQRRAVMRAGVDLPAIECRALDDHLFAFGLQDSQRMISFVRRKHVPPQRHGSPPSIQCERNSTTL